LDKVVAPNSLITIIKILFAEGDLKATKISLKLDST
jgi:hypothetical protein